MPEMILGRTRMLASTLGHRINFRKGVPIHVPPAIIEEALAMGAAYVNGEEVALGPDDEEVAADKAQHDALVNDPAKRGAAVIKAFKMLSARNERGTFDAAGRPHPRSVSKLAGFKVDAKERDTRWQDYVDELAEPNDSD